MSHCGVAKKSSKIGIPAIVCLLLTCLGAVAGCSDEVQQQPVQDAEQARQQHIETMQREIGQSTEAVK
jgi:hypothetical protein